MDSRQVQLIGVFDPDGKDEGFCYSIDAPQNLWIGALCKNGSRMSQNFMAYFLNMLFEQDKWNPGDFVDVADQDGVVLRATVMEKVLATDVGAHQAQGPFVWPVTVRVLS